MRKLLAIEGLAFLALIGVALGMAVFLGAQTASRPGSMFTPFDSAALGFGYTAIIGAPFVLLYGAPVYWLLFRSGRAKWWTAIVAGVLPGIALLLGPRDFATYAIICGAGVAATTHWASRRWR